MNQKQALPIGIVAAAALAAIAVGAWYLLAPKAEAPGTTTTADATKKERKALYWTDPMVPGFKSDKPGKSPFMDMELVPVYEDEAGAAVVSVRPGIVQNLGGAHLHGRAREPAAARDGDGLCLPGCARACGARGPHQSRRQLRACRSTREVRVADVPDRAWDGTVETVEPDVDIGARTLKARVRLDRADADLKPNMFAEATILGAAAGKPALFIPREALIRTGFRNAVVLALGEGRFQPVEVTPGVESDDWIEIRHGIKEGDVVVTSGQFLIDSEASVRASFGRMEQTAPAASPAEPKR